MKYTKDTANRKRKSGALLSRIKNPELVREKHRHIAKIASKLFIKKGYDRTTMRDISKATGMSLGNLYDYISKKEDILCLTFDVYQEYVQQDLIQITQAMKIDDPKEMLRFLVRNALQHTQIFTEEIILMYRESKLLPKKDLEKAMETDMKRISTLETVIRKGKDKGFFHVRDPFFAATMIFYQVVFLALRGWTLLDKYSKDNAYELLEEYIIDSLECNMH